MVCEHVPLRADLINLAGEKNTVAYNPRSYKLRVFHTADGMNTSHANPSIPMFELSGEKKGEIYAAPLQ